MIRMPIHTQSTMDVVNKIKIESNGVLTFAYRCINFLVFGVIILYTLVVFSLLVSSLVINTEKSFVAITLPRKLETHSANTLNILSSYTGDTGTNPLFSQIVLSGATNTLLKITEVINFNRPRVYIPSPKFLARYIGWWKRADDNIVIDTNMYIPSKQHHQSLYDSSVLKVVATSAKEQLETMTNLNIMNAKISSGYFEIDMLDFPANRPWYANKATIYGHDFHKDGSSYIIPREGAPSELTETDSVVTAARAQQIREATNGYYMTMAYPKGVQTSMFRYSYDNRSYTDIKNINTNQSLFIFNQKNIEHSAVTDIDYSRRCLIGRFFEDTNHWMMLHRPGGEIIANDDAQLLGNN